MSENFKVSIKTEARTADFVLTFDPAYAPDRNMRLTIERDGACEPEVIHVMTRVLNDGDVAIDGGANVGFFSCLMSRLVGPSGFVFAVEPTPFNHDKIETNLANNQMRNVVVFKNALYDIDGELNLHMAEDSGSNSLMPSPETIGKMKVQGTTIDEILGDRACRLIKLDVEGAEQAALEGARYALKHRPFVLCEMNEPALKRFGTSRYNLQRFMVGQGFEMFLLNNDGTLPHWCPLGTTLKSTKQNLMVMFCDPHQISQIWTDVQR